MENDITPTKTYLRVFSSESICIIVLSVEKTYLTLIHDGDYNSTALFKTSLACANLELQELS
jgi:hypothetical protein